MHLAPGSWNSEDSEQADTAAEVGPQHPGTSLTHLGMGLVNQGTEDNIGDAIKDLGHCHQGADNAGVQTDGIGQVDHNEESQERIHHIACDVTGTVADLVIHCISSISFDVYITLNSGENCNAIVPQKL